MPRNGSIYTLPYDWNDDKDNGIKVLASRMQTQDQDIATALTGSLASNGATPLTGDQDFNNNFAYNLADGVDLQDATTVYQVETGVLQYYGLTATTTSGSDGLNYTATPATNTLTDYVDGMKFRIVAHINNLADPTFALGTLANYNMVKRDGAGGFLNLEADDLILDNIYNAIYSSYVSGLYGSNCILIEDPENPYIPSMNLTKATTTTQGIAYIGTSRISYNVNNSSPTTALDFTAGPFNFSDGSGQGKVSAMTGKIINQNWSSGSGGGLLDTGSISGTAAWYSPYVIWDEDDELGDFILTLSSNSSPTLPSDYTKYKKLPGAIYWTGTELKYFYQQNTKIIFPVPIVCLTLQVVDGATVAILDDILPNFAVEANILALVSNGTGTGNGMLMYGNLQSVVKDGTYLNCFELHLGSANFTYTGSGLIYADDGNISYVADGITSTLSGAFSLQAFIDLDYQD